MARVEGTGIRIQNVVASASLNQALDLDAIVKAFPDTEWRPEVFPGLAFRLKKPKTCTLLFKTGRMVCTGAKSEREARKAVLKVAKQLKKAGIIITGKPEMRIRILLPPVASADRLISKGYASELAWAEASCMSRSSFQARSIEWKIHMSSS